MVGRDQARLGWKDGEMKERSFRKMRVEIVQQRDSAALRFQSRPHAQPMGSTFFFLSIAAPSGLFL